MLSSQAKRILPFAFYGLLFCFRTFAAVEKIPFQADVARLLHLVINSFYTDRDIFLRELISNGSDAIEVIRAKSLTDSSALDIIPAEGDTAKLRIVISYDEKKGELRIRDTGRGMSKKELVDNLGIIANSGTAKLLTQMEKNSNLIGQFGVGFYSAFLVADKVAVISKSENDDQYIWRCNSDSEFTIEKDERGNTLGRGTEVTLHLKEDSRVDFLNDKKIKELVEKHCGFIGYPIYLKTIVKKTREVPLEESEEAKPDVEKAEGAAVEDAEEKKEEKKTKTITEEVTEYLHLNDAKPIWKMDPKDVQPEQYESLFKKLTGGDKKPLSWTHFKAEGGDINFNAIIYSPEDSGNNPQDPNDENHEKCIFLYVRQVRVPVKFSKWPRFLGFVTIVVDSDDLQLNISRDVLQETKALRTLTSKLISKTLDLLKDISKNDEEKYDKLWGKFSKHIKLGILDRDNSQYKPRLTKLLRFLTSTSETKQLSLDAYIEKMRKNQEGIFYMSGSQVKDIKASPFAEKVLARGYEIIYMISNVDEYMMQAVTEYEGKKFINLTKENFKFGDETEDEKQSRDELEKEFKPLVDWLPKVLTDKIDKVIVSDRLTNSPCAIVAKEYGWSPQMQKMNKAMNGRDDPMASLWDMMKPSLEINAHHPVMRSLLNKIKADDKDKDAEFIAKVIVDTAMLSSGYDLKDVAAFSKDIERLVRQNLHVPLDVQADVKFRPASDKTAEDKQTDVKIEKKEEKKEEKVKEMTEETTEEVTEEKTKGASKDMPAEKFEL